MATPIKRSVKNAFAIIESMVASSGLDNLLEGK
jgi:hypothetical protein